MSDRKRYFPVYAGWGAAAVLMVLVTPINILAQDTTYLDLDIRATEANQGFIRPSLALQDPSRLVEVPREFGDWSVRHEYAWDAIATLLDADTVISRDYRRADVLAPTNLVLLHSTNMSSFHPPEVCLKAQHFDVADDLTKNVPLTYVQTMDNQTENVTVEMKRFVSDRTNRQGNVHTLVMYSIYVKREQGHVPVEAYWIRTSMWVPWGKGIDYAEENMQDFLKLAMPELVTVTPAPPPQTLFGAVFDMVLGPDEPAGSSAPS